MSRFRRAQVITYFASLPPCLIGMEACVWIGVEEGPPDGVIGDQSGPRRHGVPKCSCDHGSRVQDGGRGDDREDTSRVLRTG